MITWMPHRRSFATRSYRREWLFALCLTIFMLALVAAGRTFAQTPGSFVANTTLNAAALNAALGQKVDFSGQTFVNSVNTRVGAITIIGSDITTALGYTPLGPTASIGSATGPAVSGGVLTLNYTNGASYEVTVGQNITSVVLTNTPTTPTMWVINLRLIIGGAGGYTIAWPSTWTYPGGGTKPPISTTIGAVDLFTIIGGWPSGKIDLSSGGLDRF